MRNRIREWNRHRKDTNRRIAEAAAKARRKAVIRLEKELQQRDDTIDRLREEWDKERQITHDRHEDEKKRLLEQISSDADLRYNQIRAQYARQLKEKEESYHTDLKHSNDRLNKQWREAQKMQNELRKKHSAFDAVMMKLINSTQLIGDVHMDITKLTARSSTFPKMLEDISDEAKRLMKESATVLTAPLNRQESNIKSIGSKTDVKRNKGKDDRCPDNRAAG